MRVRFIYLMVLIVSLYGCERKEPSVKEPEISVIMPSENEAFSVFDTIWIKANIKHVNDIRKITLSVTDEDLKPVISAKSILLTGMEVSIDTFLVVDNKYIDKSLCYLHIEIEDTKMLFNNWTAINLIPLERELSNLMIISGTGYENNLYLIKNNDELAKIATWNSDYLGGFVDSKFNLFYTSGSVIDGLRCYRLLDKSLIWTVPVQPTGSIPYYNSFIGSDGRVSVGLWDGSIESYNERGIKVFATSKLQNGRFSQILNHQNHISGIFSPFNGGSSTLMVFNYPAGNLFNSMLLEGRPVALFPKDENTFFLLSEVNGVTKAYEYKIEEKTLYFLHNVTSMSILRAEGDGKNIFLDTGNAILWYQPETGSTVPYLSISDAECITFEPEAGVLYVSDGSQIYLYRIPEQVPYKTYTIEEPVKDVLLLYNK